MTENRDTTLDFLLELDNFSYMEDDGHWAKFEVRLVEPSPEIPHGIRYNFTYHDKYNNRLIGFDNAHAVKRKKKIRWEEGYMGPRARPGTCESL